MDCATSGSITICGNFAELRDKKPEPFDYDHTAKWIEPYPFEWRETLGSTICNCKSVKVHYAPYYGWDYFHMDSCNLMKKLAAEPQIFNLRETYLPAITHYTDAVPNRDSIPLYIQHRCRQQSVTVAVRPTNRLQAALF